MIYLLAIAGVGALGYLIWWIEIGSSRKHWKEAHEETLKEWNKK